MALDPNKLSRNELVQLLNSTALGEAITRSRLDRQMNRAGRRCVRRSLGVVGWHDGRNIRLLDYLRWLVREVERPAKPRIDGRAADLARKNTETWRSQNVAPVPDVVDPVRRQQAVASFRFFYETYFAAPCRRPGGPRMAPQAVEARQPLPDVASPSGVALAEREGEAGAGSIASSPAPSPRRWPASRPPEKPPPAGSGSGIRKRT